MIKKIFKIIFIIFCIYIGIWLAQNLDFESVFTTTADSIKYEFTPENLQRGLQSLKEALE